MMGSFHVQLVADNDIHFVQTILAKSPSRHFSLIVQARIPSSAEIILSRHGEYQLNTRGDGLRQRPTERTTSSRFCTLVFQSQHTQCRDTAFTIYLSCYAFLVISGDTLLQSSTLQYSSGCRPNAADTVQTFEPQSKVLNWTHSPKLWTVYKPLRLGQTFAPLSG
jgi:hypothetical protein